MSQMVSLFVFCLIHFPVFALSDNVPPEFGRSQYIVSNLKEKSPIGTYVFNVTAKDADGDNVTYILGGEAKSKFSINNKTGEIFVNALLTKKEYPSRISLEVSAYDSINGPKFKVTAAIYVILNDINDNTPYFINEPYNVNVSENINIGAIMFQVTANDEDSVPKYRLVSYTINSGNEEGKFVIAAYTGHISVVDTLNFAITNKYILNISAADGEGKADTTTVYINVLDYDNLPAVFDQRTYLAAVREDAPKGISVIQVSAHDGDSLNASVEYILYPVSDKNKFAINSTTGIITVNGSLDRELTSSYLLRIGAKSTYHLAVYTTVSVQILDVNDNGPVFEPNTYAAFVPENSPVDLTVLQVTATDLDVGENATLQYILSGADDKFDIRNSGHIVVKANIDREEKSQYKFVVTAQETSTSERYESNATVVINITDVNDHNPKCSQNVYEVTVDENQPNGTYVTQVVGIDFDAGKNAEIRFSFESDLDGHANLFTIDNITGNITTLNSLDRETKSMITLTVTLRDQAEVEQKRSGSCFVQVSVGDQNDNIPKFISLLNVTSVAEDSLPGTTVVTIKAQDDDVSSNAEVKYYIVSGNINSTFSLNASSGVLTTTKGLDRETIDQYKLIVNATDNGGMSQTGVVIVTILDKNDNAPKFHQPNGYSLSVDENSAALLVGIVQASDADLGSNAGITYSIVASLNSDKFTIESATGTIKTAVPLDRETTDTYKLTVIAKDKGLPSLFTNVTVRINVSDVNDNMPYFSKEHYTVSLDENGLNDVFLNLTADDKDLGINSKLRYDIISGNSEGYFTVDSNTGELSTRKSLDFEKNQIFTLLVQVHDLNGNETYGEPFQDNAVVYISVKDVNDNAPVFTQSSYSARFYENITIGSEVILVRAADEDSGENKVVEYSFVRGNELGKFFIDTNSGRVTVKETIDRDPPNNQSTFNITVMAKDSGKPALNSTVQLFIKVDDANDNAPEFAKAQYTVDLAENSTVQTSLIQLHCTDADSGSNGQFNFVIKSGISEVKPEFHIDNVTGLITSLVTIDYDVGKHEYRLVVHAVDQGEPKLFGSTTVVINIVNFNDNSPQFSKPFYSYSIKEGSYVGVDQPVGKVTATDLDYDNKSPFGQVYYSLLNKTSLFSINNVTGLITTNVVLDREQNTKYVLKIEAKDGDDMNERSNITWVYVTMLDENDNAPKFVKSHQTIHVLEDVPTGFSIANITANDPDEGLNGEVYYSLLSGNIDSHFLFNELTAELKTNKELDRETIDSYVLVIQAHDKGTPSSNSLAVVTIMVDDVNDNAPVITTTRYTSNIKENLPPGQLVCKVTASDDDNGVNQVISYSLNFPEFMVNSSGYVYTTESLDREKMAEYDIKIMASDHGVPPKSSFVIVKVGVEDTNDNYPVFSETLYSVLVSENTTTGSGIIQVTATDLDDGVNSELTFSLSGGQGHFKINKTTGLISIATLVDHESTPGGFIVFVTASDRGIPSEKSSAVQVNIAISDVNDNSPVFEIFGYEARVEENSVVGTFVVRVEAKDRDQGLLGEVAYSIVDGNIGDAFSINNSGFIVVSGNLDRETKEFYELSVKATDKAGIPKSARVKVNIRILDLNDNTPMINNAPVTLQVNETFPVGNVLFTIVASDLDLPNTNEKQLTFVSLHGDGVMKVDSDSGAVSLVEGLDYSAKQKHVLRVFAADHGAPALNSSIVNVTLVVIKKDSDIPMFGYPSYTFNITEDTAINTTIGDSLQASQRNASMGSFIVYAITSGKSEEFFKIDQQGTLILRKMVDRENQASHTITVTATNSKDPSQVGHTVVTVVISDVNDSPPVFQFKNYESEVIEDASPGTTVIKVEAIDYDFELAAKLQYSIVSGNEDGKFKIETTSVDGNNVGVISVAGGLDRETTEFYTMKVSVSDGIFYSNCSLKIRVKDINDNSPIFNPASYEASVAENTGAGSTVLRVTAVDADIYENAEVSYSISGGGQDRFTIEKTSGEIKTTAQPTDLETQSSYSFQVTATDVDGRTGSANVVVTVTDENDNAPVFQPSSYATEVIEGPGSEGKFIITVTATDSDTGVNKEIVYSIKQGNVGGTFKIDNNTGVISAAAAVDREIEGLSTNSRGHKMFSLTILATDKGLPPLSASTVVTILVGDINDNPPTFPRHGYAFMISKNATADMVVLIAVATDKDDAENGRVTYEILNGNTGGDFAMETNTGVLRTVKNLEREIGFRYDLMIQAKDHGSPVLPAMTNVSMTVGPNNDHSPILNPANYTVGVYENHLANLIVLNVTATDDDTGQNAEIKYNITAGDTSLFTLKTETYGGALMVGRLDREIRDQYVLEIEAEDGGVPISRKTTGFITVTVLDLNDNAPQFTNKSYTGSLAENSGPDVVVEMVIPVSSSDKDIGINAEVIYHIVGPGSEQFVIDRTTAVLKTRTSPLPTLDYEKNSAHVFNIIATDQAGNGLSSSVPVTIHLIDENDNTPIFLPSVLHVSTSESTAVSDVIATVFALDSDPGLNGRVNYSIVSGAEGMFAVGGADGKLRVLHELDREKNEVYNMNISGLDGNLYPRQGFGLVIVTLRDANDNPPVFEELEYTTSVSEDIPVGSEVVTVHAVDPDKGVNSIVTYSLDHPLFHVDNTTGAVRTKASLDRETAGSYSLNVRAADGGGLETSVMVNIVVDDVNDNSPYFPENNQYRSDVSEVTPIGTEIVWIVAEDDDEGKNAVLYYSLAHNVGDIFEIDSQTGVIRLKNSVNKMQLINKGLINNTGLIQLSIQVQDGGTPPRTSYQTTILKIVSSTEKYPIFNQLYYRFNVSEDAEVGAPVGEVLAVSKSSSNVLKYTFLSNQFYFHINVDNGKITTATSLNQRQPRYYIFTVRVTDGLLYSGYTSVVVMVVDVNNYPPVFQFQSPYKMKIAEDAKPGNGVGVLKATDKDWGENAKITYKFVQANIGRDGAMVAVDTSCVVALGLEKMVVLASDMTANSSFSESNKDFSATQARLNNKQQIHSGIEYQGAWCAGSNDGYQFLQVDFKRLKKIAKVATQGRPRGTSYVTKYVLRHSLDGKTWIAHDQLFIGNTNAEDIVIRRILPAFQSRYVRLQPVAWNEQICLRVEFYGCNSDGGDDMSVPFIIDETTGMVNVSDKLDYESQNKYIILVEASDHGEPSLKSNTSVEISVLDINDNAPIFDKNAYYVTLSENTFSGDVVVMVTATDADTGSNGEMRYAIVSGSRGKFRIEASTGIIQPSSRLDYEDASNRHFLLNVSATDQGTPQLSAYVTVTINIVDYNDNFPVFNVSSLVAQVRENLEPGAFVATLLATDLDSGNNALIRYSFIEPSDKFSIETESGEVKTKQRLDREGVGNYVLKVRAMDSGESPLSSDAKLLIKIVDENDNSPIFSENVYTRRILENSAVNAIAVTIKAEDQDIGVNGQVIYSISTGNEKGLFKLDNVTGIVTVAESLDREVNQSVRFTVVAQDQAAPFHRAEAEVVVMVTDVNDNAPAIEPKEMKVVINEDVAIGTFLVDVNATDKDSSSSGQLEYFVILGSFGHFKIDQYNGIMRTATQLDFETTKHFTVLVMVRDTDIKGYMDFGSVDITLLDVNDNKPTFITPVGPFKVGEDSLNGTTVGIVKASDVDTERNAEITFSITAGNFGNSFAIGASSGVILTTNVLDRESSPQYNLEITASNVLAIPVLSTSINVQIDIEDSNDNAPQFNASSYVGTVSENATVGEIAARVFAMDPDQGKAGMVSYRIINGSYSHVLSIGNHTGILTLRQSLKEGEYRNLTVIVEAKDQGSPSLSTNVSVIIMVLDTNDNPPLFDKRLYSASISEIAKVGDRVVQMIASDGDAEGNALVTYELVYGNELGNFRISAQTGWVYITRLLDRETVAQYILGVRASNTVGKKRRRRRNTVFSDTVAVEINVADVNDNFPEFIPLSYVGGVTPGADVGTLIVRVTATDKDIGPNGKLAFNISSGNQNDRFYMEQDTGSIKATNVAVGNPGSLYTLTVTVKDDMGKGLASQDHATVQIYVILRSQQAVIFSNVDPSLIRNNTDEFVRMLDNITDDGQAYIDRIYKVYTRDENGKERPSSEVVFHVVKNLTILSSDEIQRIVSLNNHLLQTVYAKWNVTKVDKIHVQDSVDDDELTGWEIALIVIGVIVAVILLLLCCFCFCCPRWKRQRLDEEHIEGRRKTVFTNSPVTRQRDSLSESTDFFSSSHSGPLHLTQSQNITNPVYCADVGAGGYEEKEMELSLSEEESDHESERKPSQKRTTFKESFRK